MTPAEYVEIVVLPTAREFLEKTEDRRLAYLSAIATYHIVDYLMRAAVPADRAARDAETRRIEAILQARCSNEYAVVEGMCHGTKHCGRDGKRGHQFTPGDERHVTAFSLGIPGAGLNEGRWDLPGLKVELSDGSAVFVDEALRVLLVAVVDAFPQHLGSVDLTGIRI